MRAQDCIVVGGGLIGLLTARELAAAGASVVVLERGRAGGESSWAGGGILSPLYPWQVPEPVTRLAQWSQIQYPQLAEALQTETGIDPEWTASGLLVLNPESRQAPDQWAARHGIRHVWLDGTGAAECQPGLGIQPDQALWLPDVAQVRNPRLTRAVSRALEAAGVAVEQDTPVTGLRVVRGRVQGVETPAGRRPAGQVVVAGGAWSAGLLAPLGVNLPVAPVRGQMLLYRGPPGLVQRIVLHDGRYVIPRRDGHVLVGSTLEHAGFDKSTTAGARADLAAAAVGLIPALAQAPVERQWAGLRPGSPEGVPFIGNVPQIRGLYVNTGHFRNGVVLAPASARLLTDLMLARAPVLEPGPYGPPPP